MRKQYINNYALIIVHSMLFFISFGMSFGLQARSFNPVENIDLIYGRDDRYEVDDYSDQNFIEKARSVAIRVSNRRLSEDRDDSSLLNFPFRKLKNAIPQLCENEKFIEQFSVGDCSGFLIAPNILVTAGHCMATESECQSNKWIFDFKEGTTKRFMQVNK